MVTVYCPKCGERMAWDTENNLSCSQAGSWLSPRMQALLPQLAHDGPVDPADARKSVNWGGSWHCPADGQVMKREPDGMRCPNCGRRLVGSVIYEITEFNPHVRPRERPAE